MEFIVVIPVWLAFCGVAAYIASTKGRDAAGIFFLALLLSPLVGIIVALVMNPNPAAQGKKKCPACAEYVQPEAKICRFCQHAFVEETATPAAITPTPVLMSEEEIAAKKKADERANMRGRIIVASVFVLVIVLFVIVLTTNKPALQSPAAASTSQSTPVPEPCCGYAAKYKEADERSSTMPKSRWNRRVAMAIKLHCVIKGMSKEEVSEALGKATSVDAFQGSTDFGEVWNYHTLDKKNCLKYAGDTCSQFAEREERVQFSLKGFSTDESVRSECVSLW